MVDGWGEELKVNLTGTPIPFDTLKSSPLTDENPIELKVTSLD
jgi:hypothetical protein